MLRVDLAGTHDTLLVSRRADSRLRDAVARQAAAVEHGRQRTVTVKEVLHEPGLSPGRVSLIAMAMALVGFGYRVVVSLLRGAVAPTVGGGIRRFYFSKRL